MSGQLLTDTITIGTSAYADVIKEKLSRRKRWLALRKYKTENNDTTAGKLKFMYCRISKKSKAEFKKQLAIIISELIVEHWEQKLILQILELDQSLNTAERSIICSYARKNMDDNHVLNIDDFTEPCFVKGGSSRKEYILQELLDFFADNDQIIIEGFIKFRLKDYLRSLAVSTGKAMDDYLMEKEYSEFIGLLRSMLELRQPRTDVLHVLAKPAGIFQLYNPQQQKPEQENAEKLFLDEYRSELNYDDFLISTLVAVAPKEIVFHCSSVAANVKLIKVIKDIFGSRFICCEGCAICRSQI